MKIIIGYKGIKMRNCYLLPDLFRMQLYNIFEFISLLLNKGKKGEECDAIR